MPWVFGTTDVFNQNQQQYLRVSVLMCDGSTFVGNIGCGLTARLENALNSDAAFVELIDDSKRRRFVSKSQIISVEPAPEPALHKATPTAGTSATVPA